MEITRRIEDLCLPPLGLSLPFLKDLERSTAAKIALSEQIHLIESESEFKDLIREHLPGFQPTPGEIGNAIAKGEEIIGRHLESGASVATIWDPEYPVALKEISDPPLILYYFGDLSVLNSGRSVAVVGTREPTEYGAGIAYIAGEVPANCDRTVVSGLARGCDTAAHRGCIAARGRTVAFLAHGLDMIYPPENSALAQENVETGGCVATEYPVGTKMASDLFKRRNRLQTGATSATFVIETDLKSGTMFTAKYARQQGRKLFVFNHPLDKRTKACEGNLKLLTDPGTIPVTEEELTGVLPISGLND